MGSTVDISWTGLLISELLLVIPLFVLGYYRTRLVKPAVISVLRMTVQLFLVGIYLGYIFKLNNPWVNMAWVVVMVGVTCQTIARRGELKLRYFLLPFVVSIVFTLIIIDIFFLGFTVRIGYLLDARYFIPITGMLLAISCNPMSSPPIRFITIFIKIRRHSALRWHRARRSMRPCSLLSVRP